MSQWVQKAMRRDKRLRIQDRDTEYTVDEFIDLHIEFIEDTPGELSFPEQKFEISSKEEDEIFSSIL